uniref:Glycosyltransferase family 92 protein n=1 Tax=Meloidogyne floridensis TaxID=298350 RepID=A0A915NCB5_9BILA
MPSTNTELDYNPNSETSWQNQLTNFQDCLYEFKESAEFIAFPDWDDFFFTSNYNIPYYPILQKFAEQNPKVNTFIIDRYMGYHESLDEMYINGHWMTDFWRQGIKYSTKDKQFFAGKKYGKAIYKPNRGIYGVDLHWANRKYKLDGRIEYTMPLELNFTAFVRRYKLSSLLNKLPKSEALTVELNKFFFSKMSENLQNSNNDLSTSLCSCSTSTFEDSLNRIKLLEVEKDKTNLAFQLILAKLDLLTINSTKQNFSANNVYPREQGLCQDQTIIKQLQELNEKMSGNVKNNFSGFNLKNNFRKKF